MLGIKFRSLYNFVTRFAKTAQNHTRTESNLWLNIKTTSSTIQTYQAYGYRWSSLLSQMVFYQPCQTMKVHYRDCEASEWYQ